MTRAMRSWATRALGEVRKTISLRDAVILVGLALVWRGLADIYQPFAPIAVGAFLLWFTTIRRVAP